MPGKARKVDTPSWQQPLAKKGKIGGFVVDNAARALQDEKNKYNRLKFTVGKLTRSLPWGAAHSASFKHIFTRRVDANAKRLTFLKATVPTTLCDCMTAVASLMRDRCVVVALWLSAH